MKTRLLERVGQNARYWTNEEFQDAFNEALSVWQALVGEWEVRMARPVLSGQVFYEVPHQIVSTQRVLLSDSPLTLTSLPELDLGFPGWQDAAAGTPLFWAPSGINEIALYPAATSGSLQFEGVGEAPLLLKDGDFLDIGEEELGILLAYAHHYLTFKEGGVEFQATQGGLVNLLAAAGLKNARFQTTVAYSSAMGMMKDEGERPPRAPERAVGIRG